MNKSYVPSPYTLSVLENYGCRTLQSGLSKTKTNDYMVTQPKYIVPTTHHACDKQNLLQQIRVQKRKIHVMSTMNLHLHHTLEKTKLKRSIPKYQHRAFSKTGHITTSLAIQVQLLIQECEKQQTYINIIKTSKKYNRLQELKNLKQIYQEQISSVKNKIRQFGHAIKENKRILTSHRKRQRAVRYMNRTIQRKAIVQNESLVQQIQNLRAKTEMDLLKKASLKRQKERIMKDILQMQHKTGKVYVLKEQLTEQIPWEFNGQQISRLQQKYTSQKQTKEFQQEQDYGESYLSESSSFETDEEQEQLQQSTMANPTDKTQNISF